MPRKISAAVETFICNNYLNMSTKEMAAHLGIPNGTVSSVMKRYFIQVPKHLVIERRIASIAAENAKPKPGDDIIKQKYLTVNVNQLSILLQRSETYIKTRLKNLKLVIPQHIIEQRKIDSRLKPGTVPPNKGKKQVDYMTPEQIARTEGTRFKKGQKVHNEQFDGAITIRHDHPDRKGGRMVKQIRLAKGKWKELQIYNWENINGPVPKGYILACIDGNTLNCEPANWELITRAENMKRNSGSMNLPDSYVAHLIAGKQYKHIKEDLQQIPELIELKRASLLIKKTKKQKPHGKSN